jgi:hypothetical protein
MRSIPSTIMRLVGTQTPCASQASTDALCAVSQPSTSSDSSASAYPSAFGVRGAAQRHLAQDVVAGAVEDAVDPRKAVRDQTLAEGLDDRDAAGDARLEEEMAAVPAREGEDFRAVLADQRLVGGDHDLAQAQRGEGDLARERRAADEFAHDLDLRIGGDRQRVRRQRARGQLHRAGLAQVAHRRALHDQADAQAPLQFAVAAAQVLEHPLPDRAEAANADLDRPDVVHEGVLPRRFSVPAMSRRMFARWRTATKTAITAAIRMR